MTRVLCLDTSVWIPYLIPEVYQHGLAALYDAAFLACAESTSAEFWTADAALVRQLTPRPAYSER
ncbi:MAG: hypothetical protein KME40_05180 [Komarekiella atlantica HA4396-MV6]|jgi:predicted nucleic acid-binding protein|nr:hypothetical protein [Komarekiella atlantica HA4396-MV6]